MRIRLPPPLALIPICILAGEVAVARPTPQPSAFTYQGQLKFNGQPATATYDFECRLFDALNAGNQVGGVITPGSIEADDNGNFSMTLDFGPSAFDGSERWLQLGVRESGGGPAFTPLSPRQKIEASPYAAFALRSGLSGTYTDAVTLNNPSNAIAGAFSGSGAGLSNLNAGAISGIINSANISGSYSNAVTLNNASNTFTGSGAGLTALNAANISAGALNASRLPVFGSWFLSGLLTIDNGTLAVDPVSNAVGIGTTVPVADLHIRGPGSLGSLLITPTTADTISQLVLAENSTNSFGMIMRMDGAANRLDFLAMQSGVEQPPVLSVNRSASPGIGIGTTSPQDQLHVSGGASGIAAISTARMIVEDDTSHFLNILSPDAFQTGVLFGTPVGGNADGGVVFNSPNSLRGLQLRTGGNVTRLTIDSAGNVGIGNTAPAARLHVSGNAQVDGEITIAAATRHESVSPFCFVATGNVSTNRPHYSTASGANVGTFSNGNSSQSWVAPINLPDGAVPTELQVRAFNNDVTTDLTVTLVSSFMASGGVVNLASVVATGGAGVQTFTDSSVLAATIDNSLKNYYVQVAWPGGGGASSAFAIHGVRIKYTITSPLP